MDASRSTHTTISPPSHISQTLEVIESLGLTIDDRLKRAPEMQARDVVDIWTEFLSVRDSLDLPRLLFLEAYLSKGYAAILHELPERFTFDRSLAIMRQHIAIKLYDQAREENWKRPGVFVVAMKMARAYLRDAIAGSLNSQTADQFYGKLGVATTFVARYESISLEEAKESVDALEISTTFGNSLDKALPYLCEATVNLYDICGDETILRRFVDSHEAHFLDSQEIAVATCGLFLRLAAIDNGGRWIADLRRACDRYAGTGQSRLSFAMFKGVLEFLDSSESPEPGAWAFAHVPFGLRRVDKNESLLNEIAPFLRCPVESVLPATGKMGVGVYVDILAAIAKKADASEALRLMAESVRRLEEASLDDDRTRLIAGEMKVNLAILEKDNIDSLIDAYLGVARLADSETTATGAYVILAHAVERTGGLDLPLPISMGDEARALALLVGRGEVVELWKGAARAALRDVGLTRSVLGGRSSVAAVGDYYGIVSESLSLKMTRIDIAEREVLRENVLRKKIGDHSRHESLGVSRTIIIEKNHPACHVARIYIPGVPVGDIEDNSDFRSAILKCADFLGFIHETERDLLGKPTGVRSDLKRKEVGRWLKNLGVDDSGQIFDEWYSYFAKVESVPRRDAHLGNWIVSSNGKISAIDLEAKGWRPLGYELAQITEDSGRLEIDDWGFRDEVLGVFATASGVPVDDLRQPYRAAILARLLWVLSLPDKSARGGIAEANLKRYAETVGDEHLAELASRVLEKWLEKRSLTELPYQGSSSMGAHRVRLSKAAAYYLRHDEDLERTKGGWTEIDHLADAMQVPSIEVASLVSDPREVRFEVKSGMVRARYGHSVEVDLPAEPVKESTFLYHATPWENAHKILEEREGLKPQGRQFVHLAIEIEEAVANGMRRGHPLVLAVSPGVSVNAIKASSSTVLSPYVNWEDLEVVPLSAYWDLVPVMRIGPWGDADSAR